MAHIRLWLDHIFCQSIHVEIGTCQTYREYKISASFGCFYVFYIVSKQSRKKPPKRRAGSITVKVHKQDSGGLKDEVTDERNEWISSPRCHRMFSVSVSLKCWLCYSTLFIIMVPVSEVSEFWHNTASSWSGDHVFSASVESEDVVRRTFRINAHW